MEGTIGVSAALAPDFTQQEKDEFELSADSHTDRLTRTTRPDGSFVIEGNVNAPDVLQVARARANANGGVVPREDVLAVVHAKAIQASGKFDTQSPYLIKDYLLNGIMYEGIGDSFGTDDTSAKKIIGDELDNSFSRLGLVRGSREQGEYGDIVGSVKRAVRGVTNRNSRHARVLNTMYQDDKNNTTLNAEGKVGTRIVRGNNPELARKNTDLYNIYRYDTKLREQYWADRHPNEKMPPLEGDKLPQGEFYKEAYDFANWVEPRLGDYVKDYESAAEICMTEEIMRRLSVERSENLDFNQVQSIISAVTGEAYNDKDDVSYNDSYKWKSFITASDIAAAKDKSFDAFRMNRGRSDKGDALEAMKQVTQERKETEKKRAEVEKQKAAMEKKQHDETEKRKMAKNTEVFKGQQWCYDGQDNDGEKKGVRIHAEEYKRLCDEYGLKVKANGAGDDVMIQLSAGGRSYVFNVIGTYDGDDYGAMLNSQAVQDIKSNATKRSALYKVNWYDHIEKGANVRYFFNRQ